MAAMSGVLRPSVRAGSRAKVMPDTPDSWPTVTAVVADRVLNGRLCSWQTRECRRWGPSVMSDHDTVHYQPFTTTHWSLVDQAGQGEGDTQRLALGELIARYTPALRTHLMANKKVQPDRAKDLVQGFLTDKVVERKFIAEADRTRGKFRTLLLTALDRYVIDVIRRAGAKKRSPGQDEIVSIDENVDYEDKGASPDRVFDVAWARQVIDMALEQMQAACAKTARPDIWGVFESRILAPTLHGTEPTPYEQLVEQFGFDSPAQATNVTITSKRMFQRVLRSVVGEYARAESAIDEEIADLLQILSAGGAGSLPSCRSASDTGDINGKARE